MRLGPWKEISFCKIERNKIRKKTRLEGRKWIQIFDAKFPSISISNVNVEPRISADQIEWLQFEKSAEDLVLVTLEPGIL